MKCPKCSYTSFDYHDQCKKCGTELRDTRSRLQVIAVSPEDQVPFPGPELASGRGFSTKGRNGVEAPRDDLANAAEPIAYNLSGEDEEEAFPDRSEPSDSFLADLRFDESFERIVEPDGPEPMRIAKVLPHETEELLDLDFGDVFGERSERRDAR
jgi:hypothetical protein